MARRSPELPASYDDLLARYYGLHHRRRRRHHASDTLEGVLDPDGRTVRVVTMSVDDGEVIPQRAAQAHHEEYVVEPQAGVIAAAPPAAPTAATAPPPAPAPAATPAPQPPAADPAPSPPPAAAPAAPAVTAPVAAKPAAAAAAAAPPADKPAAQPVDEEELAADMKAILSGQAVYDPDTGRTRPREQARPQPAPAGQAPPGLPPNGHAIFDAIAQSMQHANAYDLGTIDLDDRFDDFDRLSELQDRGRSRDRRDYDDRRDFDDDDRRGDAGVGPADFLQDMDAIRDAAGDRLHDTLRQAAEAIGGGLAHATCLPSAVALGAAAPPPFARPMYDTGEHDLAAEGIYTTPLTVGAAPGVPFTYAQIVTMPDLYGSVTQMMGASASELTGLKALIERSTAHYRDGSAADVGDNEWQTATGGRYLVLAEDNFTHFAPDTLFNDAIASAAPRHSNHKEAWETHHGLALQEARGAGAGAPPAHALIVNAFGDHFLTDAFAAGHLVNKDAVANYFRHNFVVGGHLTSTANAFFDRLAQRAFVGQVRDKFSRLETSHWPHWYVPFHPNIDSPSRFASLLKAICEARPDRVANLAVKAIHDNLNTHGIEVTNDAGDGPWQLTGDGHLTDQTKAVMQRAVQASVANVTDPQLRAADDATCFGRVWRFTPKLTAASRPTVINLVHEYTNPASTNLSDAAADLITREVDQLIHALVDQEHQLRPA
jgi:hypothetical protein